MKRVMLLTLAAIGLAFGARPDFSGRWILDLNQSRFGKIPKPTGMTLVATVQGDAMHAVQTADSEGGPVTTESDWVPDGREHDAQDGTKTMTRWDGDTLFSERKSAKGALQERIWLKLSQDGKTATEKVWTNASEGATTRTLVWHRI